MKMRKSLARTVLLVEIVTGILLAAFNSSSPTFPFPSGVPRVGKVEQPLIDYMSTVPAGSNMSIIVVMTNQLNEEARRDLFKQIEEADPVLLKKTQRSLLIEKLHSLATNSQEPLLTYLRPLEATGVIHNLRPLWLVNVMGMDAPSNVIYKCASFIEVDHIHLDSARRVIQGTLESVDSDTTRRVSAALRQIHADEIRPPTRPSDVVVAVLDAGVDIGNIDLAGNIWTNLGEFGPDGNGTKQANKRDDDHNGYTNDVNGWNFAGSGTNDVTDQIGHGTAVAGIIAGNGRGGTRTGVATNAQIMVLRFSGKNDSTGERECFEALQYALHNNADILNFSGAFPQGADLHLPDDGSWRYAVQNLTAGGVLFVTAEGESGIQYVTPFQVPAPAKTPGALAVSEVDQADSTPLHGNALQGPVTWSDVPDFGDYPYEPGLNKPDLVAPGKDVRTLSTTNRVYVNFKDTSASTPFVSGVAALLLERNPGLNAYDLRFILEESAFRTNRNEPYPNNTYGWGRVDATNALGLAWDSRTAYDLTVRDGKVDSTNGLKQLSSTVISASVTNKGGQVVGNVEMRFYFADASTSNQPEFDIQGKPNPIFEYLGSYFVPVIGPAGTKHASFSGYFRWPAPRQVTKGWCFGVWVQGGNKSREANQHNNFYVFTINKE